MTRAARITALVLLSIVLAGTAVAQDATSYHLGAGDVVQLNVLQQPDLDAELLIRPDGTAVVPPVGEIALAGLTPDEAEELLTSKLRLFNREITDVSVTVLQYNALRIYVLGAVGSPGSYTFDSPPTLWSVIREAGGVSPDANASVVRVVAVRDGLTVNSTHDLVPFLAGTGAAPDLLLHSGDTVIIPTMAEAVAPPELGVQVFGGVAAPGVYPVTEPTPLMSVLMLAGAPVEEGDLEKVWWVHQRENGRFESNLVDVSLFLELGDPVGNPLVHPGDTVHLQHREPGFWRTTYPIILGTLSTGAAVLFTLHRIQQ